MHVSGVPAGVDPCVPSSAKAAGVDRRLSRKQRLSDSRAFRETFRDGRRRAGKFLVMWLRYAEDACLRMAVIVSKNTLNRSVDRSRAKRLLRESYRLNRHRFKGKVDIILVARRDIIKARRQDVDADVLRLAKEAGILAE